jgi:hypothetical protein
MGVKEIAEIIRDCGMVYSYHAGAAWLARWQCAPMVVVSGTKHFSEGIFPWSVWYGEKSFDEIPFKIFDDIEISLGRRDKYLFNAELYKYAVPGTHVWQNLQKYFHLRSWPYVSHSGAKQWERYFAKEQKDIEKVLEKLN